LVITLQWPLNLFGTYLLSFSHFSGLRRFISKQNKKFKFKGTFKSLPLNARCFIIYCLHSVP
jgi:hypothetical protein